MIKAFFQSILRVNASMQNFADTVDEANGKLRAGLGLDDPGLDEYTVDALPAETPTPRKRKTSKRLARTK